MIFPLQHRPTAGFTLLELCIVLFIMVLLAGVSMPALRSALVERGLRDDENQLGLLVRTAMRGSSERQQSYLLELDGKTLTLAPQGDSGDAPTSTVTLDHALLLPDADHAGKWIAIRAGHWTFEPDGLCPLPRVRFQDGEAFVETGFNALTGGVEDEAISLP